MAMTRIVWNKLQKNLPPEDRASYADYLSAVNASTIDNAKKIAAANTAPAPTKTYNERVVDAIKSGTQATTDVNGNPVVSAPVDPSTLAVKGSNVFQMLGDVLYFNGLPFTGKENGFNYVNGKAQNEPAKPVVPPFTYNGTTGVTPTQVVGGGATGNMPGGATGFSGGFTQVDIDKAFKSGQDAKATTVAADKLANNIKASDKLIALFKAQGIDDVGFAKFINDSIMNDVSEAQTLIELYDQPVYKLRFPGMDALRKKNRTITESQYIGLENQMVETLRFYDLPVGFYDDRATLGSMIANEVSPKEVQDRAQMAQDLARSADPNVRNALMNFYKVGEGAITAYFLNSDKALPLLEKSAKSAQIAGIGKTYGFDDFGKSEAEQLGINDNYAKLNESDLTRAFGQASTLAQTQERLATIEQSSYSDREALAATIEGDQQSILASTKRAQREQARFSGSGGLSSYSLRTGSDI